MSTQAKPTQDLQRALAEAFGGVEKAVCQQLTELDPWSASFAEDAWQGVNTHCLGLWPLLQQMMPGQPDIYCLQQAWAARFEARVHIGLLHRAALAQAATVAEARRLRGITLERWARGPGAQGDPRHRVLVDFLMAPNAAQAGIPDLGRHTGLRGSIRLRYRVAHTCGQGASLSGVLNVAATQPAATLYQRKVELARAVQAATEEGRELRRTWRRIGEREFSLLSQPSQELLLDLPSIWPLVMAQSLAAGEDVKERCITMMFERERLAATLHQLMQQVRGRRFDLLDETLARIPDTALARTLCGRLKLEPWDLSGMVNHPATHADFGPWVPMSPQAFARLQAWAPQPLPRWWVMSGPEFAARVCTGEFNGPSGDKVVKVLVQDLLPMRRTWPVALQEQLIRSGYGPLLNGQAEGWMSLPLADLATAMVDIRHGGTAVLSKRLEKEPDARAWLAMMAQAPTPQHAQAYRDMAQTAIDTHWRHRWDYGWGRWVVQSYGCEGWDSIEKIALARTTPLKEAVSLFAAGKQPLVPGAFQAVVARSLHHEALVPSKALTLLKAWMVRDPLAARAITDHAPADWVDRLARNPATPLQALDVMATSKHLPPPIKRHAWRNRLARTQDARELATLAAHMPAGMGSFQNLNQWLPQGPAPVQALGLLMTARRDGARLAARHKKRGGEAFAQACADGVEVLLGRAGDDTLGRTAGQDEDPADIQAARRARHDAAVLELLQHLGGEQARALLQCVARRDHSAAAGCKLDGAYTHHTIPKRNGGERVIHAPAAALKQVQRAILNTLLMPLGVHGAACGFVPGRNITHNALPHVGQAVVVNADICNCFPSVSWSLVRAAWRRHWGERLSPQAISLLVDLTTAQGGLPVGAPSSPALLNLVLWRSDEILQAQATRLGAHYTRYADDLTFSGGPAVVGLLKAAERTLAQIGLELDPKKTNVFRRGRRQMVTGLVVNDQVAVPRAIRRRLRAAVHQVEQGGQAHWAGLPQDTAALKGRLGFVAMVQPEHAAPLLARLKAQQ